MKRRILAITLSLAMLLGAFAATGLTVGAADDLYVTNAKYIPDKVNYLEGKTPTSGWEGQELGDGDASLLTDSAYSKTAEDGWQAPYAAGSRLVFNLGGVFEVDTVLIGSVADTAKYVKDFTLFVASSREQLFTAESLAISSDMLEKGGRITQPGETIQNGLISILGKGFKGRFVGFDFSSAANAAVFGETIALGELGVYGKSLSAAPVIEMVEDIPFEENLLREAIPTSGYTGKTPSTVSSTGDIGMVTDDLLATDANKRWGTPFGSGDRLTWDLGKTATIYKFLIGSELGKAEWITKAKIYVSDNVDDLYKDNSLQLDLVLTGQNNTVTIQGGGITGRYVAFDFSESCEPNGGTIRYFFRLGELGVYGMTAPKVDMENTLDGVELSWLGDTYAEGFYVERSQLRADVTWTDWVRVADVDTNVYMDTNVVNGQDYRYRVRCYNSQDQSGDSAVVVAKYLAPCEVTAAVASGKIQLKWSQNDAVSSYIVYRQQEYGDDWGVWENIATTTLPTYTDGTAENGVAYRYAVSAVSSEYTSALKESAAVRNGSALTAPTVKASNATKGIKVTWNKVSAASGYRVYRRVYASGKWNSWTRIKSTSATSYTDTGAKAGKNYQYMVKAVKGDQTSGYKATATVKRMSAPTVKVSNATKGIKVTWNKVTGAASYRVYRRVYASGKWSSWTRIKSTSVASYTDTGAKAGKKYQYMVRAVNGNSTSYYKATSTICRLTVPTAKAAKTTGGIKVTWNKVTKAEKYEVYRRVGSGEWKKVKTTTSRSYVDKTAKAGKYYSYYVRAVNGSSKSYYKASSKVKR